MEVAGLTFGALTLVGLFGDIIDLVSMVGTFRNAARDYAVLVTKLDIERALLLQWADSISLLSEPRDPRLDDAATRESVGNVLLQLRTLLSEAAALREYHQPRRSIPRDSQQQLSASPFDFMANPFFISRRRVESFRRARREIGRPMPPPPTVNGRSSVLRIVHWVVKDKADFASFVDDIRYFVEKLNAIVPPLPGTRAFMAREDINLDGRAGNIQLIQTVSHDWNHEFESAAAWGLERKCERVILDRLARPAFPDRKKSVSARYKTTFEWSLSSSVQQGSQRKWDSLAEWLRSGHGIYWVRGKAGSGKSTLMKFLCDNKATEEHLGVWAGRKRICTTAHFFLWRVGTEQQKSLPGLFRSVLFQILRSNAHLCKELLPQMWKEAYGQDSCRSELPTLEEMQEIFKAVPRCAGLGKVCLFIDGLDEFAGNYSDGIAIIEDLVSGPNLKIVVSSRPEPALVDAFRRFPHLRLEELTRDDVKQYIRGNLCDHPYMRELQETDPEEADAIVSKLTSKAFGVFLWVVLACRSLLTGFASFDRPSELQQRIDELPPELEDLFQDMLLKVETRYRSQAAKLLKTCYTHVQMGSGGIPSLGLALFDEHGLDTARIPPGRLHTHAQMLAKCRFLEGRLRSRCGGLLELHVLNSTELVHMDPALQITDNCFCGRKEHEFAIDSVVGFMHRTVFEFLDHDETWTLECLRIDDDEFDPVANLACISLHLARQRAYTEGSVRQFLHHVRDLWMYSLNAVWEPCGRILPVVLALEDLIRLAPRGLLLQQQCDDSGVLSPSQLIVQLGIEASMFEVVAYYWKRQPKLLQLWPNTRHGPILKIATHQNMTLKLLGKSAAQDRCPIPRIRPAHQMVRFLLSMEDGSQDLCTGAQQAWDSWVDGLTSRIGQGHDYGPEALYGKASIIRAYLETQTVQLGAEQLRNVAAWIEEYAPQTVGACQQSQHEALCEEAKDEFRHVSKLLEPLVGFKPGERRRWLIEEQTSKWQSYMPGSFVDGENQVWEEAARSCHKGKSEGSCLVM